MILLIAAVQCPSLSQRPHVEPDTDITEYNTTVVVNCSIGHRFDFVFDDVLETQLHKDEHFYTEKTWVTSLEVLCQSDGSWSVPLEQLECKRKFVTILFPFDHNHTFFFHGLILTISDLANQRPAFL